MTTFKVSNLIATLAKFSLITVFVFASFVNGNAQDGTVHLLGVSVLQSMFVEGNQKLKRENFPNSFSHHNQNAFSVEIHGFKDEKVKVSIYERASKKALYSINIEPKSVVYHAELLTKPLPKGTYYVVVEGESRVIPKEMSIE